MSETVGIFIFVVAILVVIFIHESGHFFTAKLFGIKVEEFFIGFGPRVWSFRRGETEYGVKALPLGGYVRIAGMNPFQESAPEDLPRTYGAKPIWQRFLVIVAGPFTHFLMAFVFVAVFFMAIGVHNAARPLIEAVEPTLSGQTSPAAAAGLRAGDEILSVDGQPVESLDQFVQYTRAHVGRQIAIEVRRGDRTLTVRATPVLSEIQVGDRTETVGRLGVILGAVRERLAPWTAVARSGVETGTMIKNITLQLGEVFGPSGLARIGELLAGDEPRRVTDPTGIVGGARVAGEAVRAGAWDTLFELLVVFNIFVGIINLAPLPPLDGGHVAVLVYEKVRRRKPDLRKLVPIAALVTGFLVFIVVSITYLDIVRPLPDLFR